MKPAERRPACEEMVESGREKKYQTKAFLLMPIMFNVGALLGPLFGGWLQDPVHTFPDVFGPGSRLGGVDGVGWMLKFPYALPNLLNGLLLFIAVLLVIFGLEEVCCIVTRSSYILSLTPFQTHMDRKHLPDHGLKFGRSVARIICLRPRESPYSCLEDNSHDLELSTLPESSNETGLETSSKPQLRPKLPLCGLLRRNVLATFLAHGLMAGHISAFQNLWFLFLSTPRFDSANPKPLNHTPRPPIFFTGGLGLSPIFIGTAIGLNGFIGLMLQFGVYSWITSKLGVVHTYRYALAVFPLTYAIAPFLSLLPTSSASPHAADGPWIWLGICTLLLVVVTGRTFAQPSSLLLINNCTPHPSVLSTVHSIAQSLSAGCRTLGPLIFSSLYGEGLKIGVVGMAWWILMVEAFAAFGASWLLYEGNGHEVQLEGDL